MKVGAMIRAFACVLAASFPLVAFAGPAPDSDNDGTPDVLDNCTLVAQTPGVDDCDSDTDGYGNLCDGDFNQDNAINGIDFGPGPGTFLTAFLTPPPQPTANGEDMNCDNQVNGLDFSPPFLNGFTGTGAPGPSGLGCAGTPGCM